MDARGRPESTSLFDKVPPMDTVAGLRLIIRVVETGSFSKARAELGITQPTATKHVAPRFMQRHPGLQIDPGFEDRCVDLVEQRADVALRMARRADSAPGARYLGVNPWVLATSKGSGFMRWLQGQFEGDRWAPHRVRPRR
jgi:DNA-binding transcriptional LysR family regulator